MWLLEASEADLVKVSTLTARGAFVLTVIKKKIKNKLVALSPWVFTHNGHKSESDEKQRKADRSSCATSLHYHHHHNADTSRTTEEFQQHGTTLSVLNKADRTSVNSPLQLR